MSLSRILLASALFAALAAPSLHASSPKFFQAATQADFLKGEVENLSIDARGQLVLGPATGSVSVSWDAFADLGAGARFEVASIGFEQGWAEHLTPLVSGSSVTLSASQGTGLWFTVYVPESATAGDHSVIVWNLHTGKALHRLPCERDSSFCSPGLAFSPDGSRLGYVRGTFFACVWDLQTGKEMRQFERRFGDDLNRYWAGYCQFANGGKELVLFSRGAVETWNVALGQQLTSVPVQYAAFLSPDGQTYLGFEGVTRLSLGDARTGKVATRLEVAAKHDGIENGMAFSPDGKTLAMVHDRKEIQRLSAGWRRKDAQHDRQKEYFHGLLPCPRRGYLIASAGTPVRLQHRF
jgi:WD40 repeat protein